MPGAAYDAGCPTPFGLGLHHVQLCAPAGTEDECRDFWVGRLGFVELRKPPELAGRGGIWVRADDLEIHIGVEEDFRPARKAHPGILVGDLDGLARHCEAQGLQIVRDDDFPGFRRFYLSDNCGNRLEFLQPDSTGPVTW
jgi:catechol 2,3-dioxygenase-like lactoylglutathione lyase family enzyme